MHGRLRLGSFHEILTFVGRSIEEKPEVDVPLDQRTATITENPVHTLEIIETRQLRREPTCSVAWHGYHHASAGAKRVSVEQESLLLHQEPLYGRESDALAIAAMVHAHAQVVIIGAGGIGKTRLALAVANAHRERFPDGVCGGSSWRR